MRKLIITLCLLSLAGSAAGGETEIVGFADASYFTDSSAKNGEFGLDQVELDIIHTPSERTLLRADLEWVRDGEEYVADVEQGFMTWTFAPTWDLTFGKFNAPIGFELLDPPDMFQYSHALVFDYGLPSNLTGAAVATSFGRGFGVVAHVSNGWDRNSMAGKNVTWGGRFGYAAGGFGGGISALSGKEEDETDATPFRRNVLDVDLSYETGIWLFGAELNRGKATTYGTAGEVDQEWDAFLLMTHVAYADWTGLTVRFDSFNDKDGWAFPLVAGEPQKIGSVTVCPTFSIDENFTALVELRYYTSDRDGFSNRDGEATDNRTEVAFEMTCVF